MTMSMPDDSSGIFTEIFFYKQVCGNGTMEVHVFLLPCPHPCPSVSLSDLRLFPPGDFQFYNFGNGFVCGKKKAKQKSNRTEKEDQNVCQEAEKDVTALSEAQPETSRRSCD